MLTLIRPKSEPVDDFEPKSGEIMLLVQTHYSCYRVPGEFDSVEQAKARIPAIMAEGVEVKLIQGLNGSWGPISFRPTDEYTTEAFFVGPTTIASAIVVTAK